MKLEDIKRKTAEIQKKIELGEISPKEAIGVIGELKECLESEELCDDPISKLFVKHMRLGLDMLEIIVDDLNEREEEMT